MTSPRTPADEPIQYAIRFTGPDGYPYQWLVNTLRAAGENSAMLSRSPGITDVVVTPVYR
jgi:hypothetical protein